MCIYDKVSQPFNLQFYLDEVTLGQEVSALCPDCVTSRDVQHLNDSFTHYQFNFTLAEESLHGSHELIAAYPPGTMTNPQLNNIVKQCCERSEQIQMRVPIEIEGIFICEYLSVTYVYIHVYIHKIYPSYIILAWLMQDLHFLYTSLNTFAVGPPMACRKQTAFLLLKKWTDLLLDFAEKEAQNL